MSYRGPVDALLHLPSTVPVRSMRTQTCKPLRWVIHSKLPKKLRMERDGLYTTHLTNSDLGRHLATGRTDRAAKELGSVGRMSTAVAINSTTVLRGFSSCVMQHCVGSNRLRARIQRFSCLFQNCQLSGRPECCTTSLTVRASALPASQHSMENDRAQRPLASRITYRVSPAARMSVASASRRKLRSFKVVSST